MGYRCRQVLGFALLINTDKTADNANNHIMHWTYGSHYTNQHFRLERKPNGNWAMKSVSMDKYLEVFSGDNNAKIYACEPNFRDRPTQEWWITFTGAGLM